MDSTVTILTILVTVIGVIGLLQLVILFVMYLGLKKGMKEVSTHAGDIKAHVNPLIDQSKEAVAQAKEVLAHSKGVMDQTKSLIARLEPKLEMAAIDLADITRTASEQAKNLSQTSTEISDRVRRQALRLESMSNRTLDGVDKAGHFVGAAFSSPMRQFSGVVAAARAVMGSFRKAPGQRTSSAPRVHTTPIRDERTPEQRAERSYYAGPESKVR